MWLFGFSAGVWKSGYGLIITREGVDSRVLAGVPRVIDGRLATGFHAIGKLSWCEDTRLIVELLFAALITEPILLWNKECDMNYRIRIYYYSVQHRGNGMDDEAKRKGCKE